MSTKHSTTIELRGRDLIIMPPEKWQPLPLVELLTMLFGPHLPAIRSLVPSEANAQAGLFM